MQYREFMEAGFRVFPLHGFTGDKCHCSRNGCSAPGKHPRSTNWQHTPENTPEHMEEQEEAGMYKSGYGVLCKGLLVIDVDARNNGVASYAKLLEKVPEIAGAGMVVETGSGGGSKHLYFSLKGGISLVTNLKQYPGIDFKSGGFVVGPGSRHVSGKVYKTVDGSPYDIDGAPQSLIDLLKRPEKQRVEYDGHPLDVGQKDLIDILDHIPNNDLDYEEWIKVGMALHHTTNGTGYLLWDKWSEQSSKYDDTDMDKKWLSFGKSGNPVTIGSLIHEARKHGWKMPIAMRPVPAAVNEPEPEPEKNDGLPFDVSGVDLLSPPGFVGTVTSWIESCNRRPRRRLSVATALASVSNVMGLRFYDPRDGITPNLFIICVAGSRTGKEGLIQSAIAIHRKAGLAGATHGAIKSEQEVIRNLIEHQPAFYVLDEIGITLQKIRNAQKRGTAAYLEGVVGMLMSAYSKADGYLPVSGDIMRELKTEFKRELSQLEKSEHADEDWVKERIDRLLSLLNSPEPGLKNPFLSIIGFTTPVTFDDLVDLENATNGFVGRSLLFNERDTAPRSKELTGFVKPPMPFGVESGVLAISATEPNSRRIEYPMHPIAIETDETAAKMLGDALVWFEDQAEAHMSRSGLESLYLGAYELMGKVSLILAAHERLRTAEHVRWAFELVRRDVEAKARLVVSNDREKDAPAMALMARLANLCGGENGATIGVIYNRTRGKRQEDVDETLAKMVENGVMEKTPAKQKGSFRYRYVGDG